MSWSGRGPWGLHSSHFDHDAIVLLPLQDVFTISVGNLPPGATVLIKVTFVSELIIKDGSILFSLPGSVAPWQESAALNQTTQVRKAWTGPRKKSFLLQAVCENCPEGELKGRKLTL